MPVACIKGYFVALLAADRGGWGFLSVLMYLFFFLAHWLLGVPQTRSSSVADPKLSSSPTPWLLLNVQENWL